ATTEGVPIGMRANRRSCVRLIALGGIAVALLGASAALPRSSRLIWNATPSAPLGFYWRRSPGGIQRGDFVLATPPTWAALLAAQRDYLPVRTPLVKRAAAIPGDVVCAVNGMVSIDGQTVARQLPRDGDGRPLPAWSG